MLNRKCFMLIDVLVRIGIINKEFH